MQAIGTGVDLTLFHSHFAESKHELLKAMNGGSATTFGASYSAMLDSASIEPVVVVQVTEDEIKASNGF